MFFENKPEKFCFEVVKVACVPSVAVESVTVTIVKTCSYFLVLKISSVDIVMSVYRTNPNSSRLHKKMYRSYGNCGNHNKTGVNS